MRKKRGRYSSAIKAKVALMAVQEQHSAAEIARRFGVHANLVAKWKKELVDNVERVFEATRDRQDGGEREAELLRKIGELTVERDFLSRGLGRLS